MFLLIIIWLESVELICINNKRHMLNTLRVSKIELCQIIGRGGGMCKDYFHNFAVNFERSSNQPIK